MKKEYATVKKEYATGLWSERTENLLVWRRNVLKTIKDWEL